MLRKLIVVLHNYLPIKWHLKIKFQNFWSFFWDIYKYAQAQGDSLPSFMLYFQCFIIKRDQEMCYLTYFWPSN